MVVEEVGDRRPRCLWRQHSYSGADASASCCILWRRKHHGGSCHSPGSRRVAQGMLWSLLWFP